MLFGPKLSFTIESSTASANTQPFSLVTPALKPGQSGQVGAVLTVFRGQAAVSGTFTSHVAFALSPADAAQGALPIDQVLIPLTCIVPPIFEINLAGSGQSTTVQFGNLAANETASVVLMTRTTGNHQLEFQSRHNGYLALQSLAGLSAKIPYSLALDGRPVALAAATFLKFTTGPGEAARRLTFTIGDTSGKLAGTYTDVITVNIASAL